MQYIPYNSRKGYHKTPFGAVAVGTAVQFRIILPRDFRVTGSQLVMQYDGCEETEVCPMLWERMEGDSEEWWQASFIPAKAGLYWYHFEYTAPGGRGQIYHAGNGLGNIEPAGESWQLTVYNPAFQTPDWLKGGIIYQIFPDRFFCSGTAKSDVPQDRVLRADWGSDPLWEPDLQGRINKYDYFCGDLKGIAQKLCRLEELGVTCLYLNPIFEAHSNHRYDTADYMKIDSLLGTEEDFSDLCFLARERGIRVILDGVFSHTGDDSLYFNRKNRYPSSGAYNSVDSPYFPWYKFLNWPDDYKSWWGVDILPEIREDEPGFIEFISGENGVARKWLRAGASGWRLDVADELPDEFLDAFRRAVKAEKADAYILGEVWEDASNKCSYGTRRHYLLGKQLDSVMNYPFTNALLRFIQFGLAEDFMESVLTILENYPSQAIHTLMNPIGTHDTVRAITRLSGVDHEPKDRNDRARERLTPGQKSQGILLMKLTSAIQFTLPGIPCIYYGDEAGAEGGQDPFNRGCYPWGREDKQLLDHYKRLGSIRKQSPALIDGEFTAISADDGCIAFSRMGNRECLLTIANSKKQDIDYKLPEKWQNANVLLGSEAIIDGRIKVGACSATIVEIKCL